MRVTENSLLKTNKYVSSIGLWVQVNMLQYYYQGEISVK